MAGRSAQLVRQRGDDGGLEACAEGVALLRSLGDRPIKVVCVAGNYRSGKSTLLNRLIAALGSSGKFDVGNTTASCTRGIWVFAVEDWVILDSEGLASVDQDETYDAKVFTLGLLLSSFFLFNSMGVIDESAIDRLYMVAKLAQKISKDNKIAFRLLWVLRDFSLSLEDFKGDENAYLEDALSDRKAARRGTAGSNEQRSELRRVFRNRQCRTLVRPVLEEADLRRLDTLPESDLRPEFVRGMHGIFDTIKAETGTKKMAGQSLSGPMLALFLSSCLEAINGGAVPNIKKSFEYIAEQTYREIKERGEQQYKEEMNHVVAASWREFAEVHENARASALALFLEPGVLETAQRPAMMRALDDALREACMVEWDRFSRRSVQATEAFVATAAPREADPDTAVEALLSLPEDLGPERHDVVSKFALNDLVRARLLPAQASLQAEVDHQQERVVQLEDLLQDFEATKEALAQERQALAVQTADKARLAAQLEASLAASTALSKRTDAMEDKLDQTRQTLQEKMEALQQETTQTNVLREELSSQQANLDMLRKELQDILTAAGKQQEEFDMAQAEAEELRVRLEVALCLRDIVHDVETAVLTGAKDRITEERAALHAKLQDFFMRASTLPDYYQDQVFCSETGLLEYF
ncbi:Guanylate-binding protein 1 (GTP-binding protein 2) (GBP-2) (Guanine nucleotide-binding protein 2) (Interferon-induced guanylate-binding protein 2) (p67) [Durusdinium trenchii]|uniref:Guanylate-binding protein 1 (GTP-binding protein 2) (GBP-2) (Guanine nucleotide-binding protein 2) (Interferon-induced guanylate-binding protein 2) (p67) n=1 Tax=Durusdinium trenchii TaxID=1381693 RepID=A0ABP0SMQ2_9DINO